MKTGLEETEMTASQRQKSRGTIRWHGVVAFFLLAGLFLGLSFFVGNWYLADPTAVGHLIGFGAVVMFGASLVSAACGLLGLAIVVGRYLSPSISQP